MNTVTPKKKSKAATGGDGATPEIKKSVKSLKRKSTDSVEAILTDASGVGKKKKTPKKGVDSSDGQEQKPKKFEKGKKKPLNVINNAAKKLKKRKNENEGESDKNVKKGVKRKLENDESKTKLEEMKFKDRKKMRKTFRTNHETAHQAKRLWEQLRRVNITSEKKLELANKLYELVKGRSNELIFAHDTSRVIQCLMKYGSQEHKNAVFEELKEEIVKMTKTKYAKFMVRKMLKYGTKEQRKEVFTALYGNVRKLIKHQEAVDIVELAYNDYADALERSALVEEFYGPSFALFKTSETRSLGDIMTSHPEKRDSILSNMKDTLCSIVNKSICQYSIVHRVFFEYFSFATDKARSEMIEVVRESLVHMLHTRDGSRVAMQCLWHGTAKDRKVIVKSLKTFVEKICKEEYGHLVLLAIFDSVDDTKIVQKVVLEEMMKCIGEVAQDQHGRKVLFYLLTPRNPKHFHPDIIRILQEGDGNSTSKKEPAVRQAELLSSITAPLVRFAKDKATELVMNNATMLLFVSIINNTQGDPSGAMQAVAEIAAKPFMADNTEDFHIVEHAFGHVALKRLITQDKERKPKPMLFAQTVMKTVPEENFKTWASCNRGCFILCSLLELGEPSVTTTLKRALGPIKESLKKKGFKGAEILASKL